MCSSDWSFRCFSPSVLWVTDNLQPPGWDPFIWNLFLWSTSMLPGWAAYSDLVCKTPVQHLEIQKSATPKLSDWNLPPSVPLGWAWWSRTADGLESSCPPQSGPRCWWTACRPPDNTRTLSLRAATFSLWMVGGRPRTRKSMLSSSFLKCSISFSKRIDSEHTCGKREVCYVDVHVDVGWNAV